MLVTDDGSFRYKDKSSLAALVDGTGYQSGQTIYTYCRTTYRAMVTGIAAGVVLGLPVRYYDGAMIEWLQMADYANQTGSSNLPETSPWRTDLVSASSFSQYNDPARVEAPAVTDPYGTTTNAVVVADKAYKTGSSASAGGSSGSGGSVQLPPNPCGG